MSRSSRHKEKYGSSVTPSQDNRYEGSSARTRPLSIDEILLRRKKKKEPGEVRKDIGESKFLSGNHNIEKSYDHLDSVRHQHDVSVPASMKHASDEILKSSSRMKEDNFYTTPAKLHQGKESRDLGIEMESKNKSNRESHIKANARLSKGVHDDNTVVGKRDRIVHRNRKRDERSSDDSQNDSKKRHSRNLERKDRYAGKGRQDYGKETKSRQEKYHDGRQAYSNRINDERPRDVSEVESGKKHLRDLVEMDKYRDRSRGKSESKSKRKHQVEDEERIKDRNADKNLDLGNLRSSDISKRKEEASRIHAEELRPKRRRSRSKEHDKDRGRRSPSLSPNIPKHASSDTREQGGLSIHSYKDKSGKTHSDVDRKKVSNGTSSSHYRRHAGSASGLGGYSPRKRKTEAAAKTPSPPKRSPGRRSAGWDLPPAETESNTGGPILSNLQAPNQKVPVNTQESHNVSLTTSIAQPISHSFSSSIYAIDSIQLTQATRPMRRLYVENLPTSASDKDVMECINNFLLSAGINHIQGTRPCISCIKHKEKGQALLEFLTPEDASAALAFDGRPFLGSILKIRRPKDFIEVATGVPEKSVAAIDSITSTVEDSPHKIFIGGISELISSEMLLEIAKAFGPLRAYHFDFNANPKEPYALLQYVDNSVTLKACAGLNGMKLGGQVLTVVQATPDALEVDNARNPPFYGIPKHAKSLLEKPTQVLKLKNVLDPEGLLSLAEAEEEEILEDIRMECARFGTIKSIHVVKHSHDSSSAEVTDAKDKSAFMGGCNLDFDDQEEKGVQSELDIESDLGKTGKSVSTNSGEVCSEVKREEEGDYDDKTGIVEYERNSLEIEGADKDVVDDFGSGEKPVHNLMKCYDGQESPEDNDVDVQAAPYNQSITSVTRISGASLKKQAVDQSERNIDIADTSLVADLDIEVKLLVEEQLLDDDNGNLVSSSELEYEGRKESIDPEKSDNIANFREIFEPGCILVEFRREEASCTAAHCLHGRTFEDRFVTVEYVDHDLYRRIFPK